ncbi:MAG: molybdopterin molybdotransferase MoeA [Desulfamplus sp.]|nr:molybdopterin molybdotransferase MoeA [Desulfamplus sp.]
MVKWLPIGFDEALKKTVEAIVPLGVEMVELSESTGRIAAQDLIAKVDSPSINASLKDGYAVKSEDLTFASENNPVKLKLKGYAAAGDKVEDKENFCLKSGEACRILTGAKLPDGADAVLSEEYVDVQRSNNYSTVIAKNVAEFGRNILPKGSDVKVGEPVVSANQFITAGFAGLLAASGFSQIPLFKQPIVSIIATGNEVIAPGLPLSEGKLYASNMVTLSAFCHDYGMKSLTFIVKDVEDEIRSTLKSALEVSDAIITSGGAWTGDRDMVAKILLSMGWKQIFHRIRIGPGKAVGFGILNQKPVFILPGGPPSNLMGFLQIALPGLMRLAGYPNPGLKTATVMLESELYGRDSDWTQFVFGVVTQSDVMPIFQSLRQKGRLQAMAQANAIATIPEGKTLIASGEVIKVQIV